LTVQTQTNRASYDGNGATTAFTVPFRFLANAHVRAVLRAPDGPDKPWAETTNHTATGAREATGGTPTARGAPARGGQQALRATRPRSQENEQGGGGQHP